MRIYCSDGMTDLEGTVRDDADLDGTFTLTCDDGERLRVCGWLISDLEIVEEEAGG